VRISLRSEKSTRNLHCDTYWYAPNDEVYRSFKEIRLRYPTIELDLELVREQEEKIIALATSKGAAAAAEAAELALPAPADDAKNDAAALSAAQGFIHEGSRDNVVPWSERQWVKCDACDKCTCGASEASATKTIYGGSGVQDRGETPCP
jgi:hypothetical protein